MKTITFYSYKGGVGRTLLLANVAKFLSRFGQRVFALDFDLEAPGLHHKFHLEVAKRDLSVESGLVDYISASLHGEEALDLEPFVLSIETSSGEGRIDLMPAGDVTTANYWYSLAQINWNELLYSEAPAGVPFFLNLKAQINDKFAPDYLLIDARTGITEIGGIATSILPDSVVCLLSPNRENLEGARAVLRSIKRTRLLRDQPAISIIPVLGRLAVKEGSDQEMELVSRVRNYLNEESSELSETLAVSEIPILHRDKAVELEETLLVDSSYSSDSTPLLRDYVRLISMLVPDDIIEPNITVLVNEARDAVWNDPDKAEKDLLFLAERSLSPQPLNALLRLYRLRNVENVKILRLAWKYWQLTYRASDPHLWQIVNENFLWDKVRLHFGGQQYYYPGNEEDYKPFIDIDFIYRVWDASDSVSIRFSLELAKALYALEHAEKAGQVIRTIEDIEIPDEQVVQSVRVSNTINSYDTAFKIVDKYRKEHGLTDEFLEAWMTTVAGSGDKNRAVELLRSSEASSQRLFDVDVNLAIRIYEITDEQLEITDSLLSWLRVNMRRMSPHRLDTIQSLFRQGQLYSEFENLVRKHFDNEDASRILD